MGFDQWDRQIGSGVVRSTGSVWTGKRSFGNRREDLGGFGQRGELLGAFWDRRKGVVNNQKIHVLEFGSASIHESCETE